MRVMKLSKGTKRSQPPAPTALRKGVQGIVVVAKPPQPKPTRAPLPAPTLQSNGRPEHLQPLSKVSVPAIKHFNGDRDRVFLPPKPFRGKAAKAAKRQASPRRALTQVDIEQGEFLAGHIVGILRYRLKAATKLTLISTFEGEYPAGAIARGIHIAVKRGDVLKDKTCKPAKYSIAPIAPFMPVEKIALPLTVEAGRTSVWNPPTTTGWTTQL